MNNGKPRQAAVWLALDWQHVNAQGLLDHHAARVLCLLHSQKEIKRNYPFLLIMTDSCDLAGFCKFNPTQVIDG